jgi:hypothetical protein
MKMDSWLSPWLMMPLISVGGKFATKRTFLPTASSTSITYLHSETTVLCSQPMSTCINPMSLNALVADREDDGYVKPYLPDDCAPRYRMSTSLKMILMGYVESVFLRESVVRTDNLMSNPNS